MTATDFSVLSDSNRDTKAVAYSLPHSNSRVLVHSHGNTGSFAQCVR